MQKKLLPQTTNSDNLIKKKYYLLGCNNFLSNAEKSWLSLQQKSFMHQGKDGSRFLRLSKAIDNLDINSFHETLFISPRLILFINDKGEYIFDLILSKYASLNKNTPLKFSFRPSNKNAIYPFTPTYSSSNEIDKLKIILNLYIFTIDLYMVTTKNNFAYKKNKKALIKSFLFEELDTLFKKQKLRDPTFVKSDFRPGKFLQRHYPDLKDYFELLMKNIDKLSVTNKKYKHLIDLFIKKKPAPVKKKSTHRIKNYSNQTHSSNNSLTHLSDDQLVDILLGMKLSGLKWVKMCFPLPNNLRGVFEQDMLIYKAREAQASLKHIAPNESPPPMFSSPKDPAKPTSEKFTEVTTPQEPNRIVTEKHIPTPGPTSAPTPAPIGDSGNDRGDNDLSSLVEIKHSCLYKFFLFIFTGSCDDQPN
ncbi:hypothetical protein ACFLZV_00025 [Candidatus Margulisiibacteriota bacterium]